jgi:hypothetical protein
MRPAKLATKEVSMSKFVNFGELFAAFGMPSETLDAEWQETFLRSIRETGRLVAFQENFAFWPGRATIYLFEGLYFAEHKTMHGSFETFHAAARAIHFFYISEAAPNAWLATEVLTNFQLPSHWTVVCTTGERTYISPMPADADGGFPTGGEETPLAEMARELEEKWRARGIIVTHAPPPVGPQPSVATFHPARNSSTRRESLDVKHPGNSMAPTRIKGVLEKSQAAVNPTPKASAKNGVEENNYDQ